MTPTKSDNRQLTAKSRHLFPNRRPLINLAIQDALKANALGYGVFTSIAFCRPGLSPLKRGEHKDLRLMPALWCDLDYRSPEQAIREASERLPPPTLACASGAGAHLYWILNEASTKLDQTDRLLLAIARLLNGCQFTSTQPARLPGSRNTKPDRHNKLCEIIAYNPERRYELDDFASLLRPAPRPPIRRSAPSKINSYYDPLNPDLIDAVCDTLQTHYAGHIKSNGWIASLCPGHHTRDAPGAHFNFNPELGIGHCYGKHGRIYLNDLCTMLKIDLSPFGGTIYQKAAASTR